MHQLPAMHINQDADLITLCREWIDRWNTHADSVDLPAVTLSALKAKLATIAKTNAATLHGIKAKNRVFRCLDTNHDALAESICTDLENLAA